MECTLCGGKTQVTNSRAQKRNNKIWRRRECLKCHQIFTTHESIDLSKSLTVNKNGHLEPFLADLLYTDVLLALQDRKDCYSASRELTDTIVRGLLTGLDKPVLAPAQISKESYNVLKRFNKRAALRFAAEHPSVQ